jgi:hypothetical protein
MEMQTALVAGSSDPSKTIYMSQVLNVQPLKNPRTRRYVKFYNQSVNCDSKGVYKTDSLKLGKFNK